MEPEVQFVGIKLAPGKSEAVVADYDDDAYETVHLTQVALGDKPAKGPHTVFIEADGEKFAIGTLDKDHCLHFSIDITMATDDVSFTHTGGSDVFITGYRTVSLRGYDDDVYDSGEDFPAGQMMGSDDDEEDDGDDDEEDDDEEEDDEDDEDAPRGLLIAAANGRHRALMEDQADEDDEDDEDEDDEDDDEEDDGERAAVAAGKQSVAQAQRQRESAARSLQDAAKAHYAKKGAGMPDLGDDDDDHDDDEDDDEDEDEDEDEEEDEEEAPAPAPAPAIAAPKRKQPQEQPQSKTPQPAKKQRSEAAKAPASAPTKTAAAAAAAAMPGKPAKAAAAAPAKTPGSEKEYAAALRAYLQRSGPTRLPLLGGAVKKPKEVPKLKAFLAANSAVFKYDATTDTVSLC